ncbi:MAG TPA: CsiV family protein [Gammaproteobacteria bacterium]|nr:CsiV family protein [Gammaproteobacteria bacterium]
MSRASTLFTLLGGAALAAVQSVPCAAQPAGAPIYQVEIIAFAYSNPNASEELFPKETAAEAAPELGVLPDQGAADGAEGAGAGPAPDAGGDDAAPGGALRDADAAANPDASSAAPGAPAAPGDASSNAEAPAAEAPLIDERGFRVLDASAYKLDAAYAKLEKLDAYRPLLHAAWIQPALPEEQAKEISAVDLGAENPTGGVELYASRYLHLTVNLRYHPTPEQSAALAPSLLPAQSGTPGPGAGVQNGAGAQAGGSPPLGATGPQPFGASPPQPFGASGPQPFGATGFAIDESSLGPSLMLKASRRIAAGELQYFDHPYFGLLVLVTPYEPKDGKASQTKVAPSP